METKDAEEAVSAVKAPAAKPKKVAAKKSSAKKASVKRKKPTAKSKRPRKAAKPVAPPPPPLTLQELKDQGAQAKQELVSAVVEPALEAAGSLSQTIRDTIGGAFAGLLSRKRRD
tara:strand:+ start:166 stop:510 length:345 start_codon:yes stop_codon:yes gene_type:complete